MGLLDATYTKQQYIAQKHDIERDMNQIRQAKLGLTDAGKDLLHAGTDMDPENPVLKQLEERKARLTLLEKKLDMQLDDYETKLAMINQNIQKCDETIKSSIR